MKEHLVLAGKDSSKGITEQGKLDSTLQRGVESWEEVQMLFQAQACLHMERKQSVCAVSLKGSRDSIKCQCEDLPHPQNN